MPSRRAEALLAGSVSRISAMELAWWALQSPSGWDVAVEVANRSAVLRCPACKRTGHWIDVFEHSKDHATAVRQRPGRESAGTDTADGAEIHAAIGQEWECEACHGRTRTPIVGRIRSTKEHSWRGHGRPPSLSGNSTEDGVIRWSDFAGKLIYDPTDEIITFVDARQRDERRRAGLRQVRRRSRHPV